MSTYITGDTRSPPPFIKVVFHTPGVGCQSEPIAIAGPGMIRQGIAVSFVGWRQGRDTTRHSIVTYSQARLRREHHLAIVMFRQLRGHLRDGRGAQATQRGRYGHVNRMAVGRPARGQFEESSTTFNAGRGCR